ncbi:hypothetical protein LVD15_17180 [Fulvivirga maritima]|uniref:hypothetical protein n=1 Tax=Fulvivirga maritima TaxID=2904247 RepID=UPI001F42A169|nr:hypothetical protein [Fulvivirga maritima]UII25034.1 hypothetical protein LVD15_17180 [Fulvivirga maritima]
MEKSELLFTINETVSASETLATLSSNQCEYMDCLGMAIDCADAGMMLNMKLSENKTPRTLIKQFSQICTDLAKKCDKYNGKEVNDTKNVCLKSVKACQLFLEEELHPDHYFLSPLSSTPLMTA